MDGLGLAEMTLEIYTDWFATAVKHLCKLDFDFIWVADDIAFKTGPFFSPDVYRGLFLPRLKKVVEGITIPWVYHSDGNLLPLIDDLLSLGMDGLHPIEPGAMDIFQFKKDYGKGVCVIGNVKVDTLVAGRPEDVEEEVREKIKLLAPGGGYMISTSNTFPRECKLENVWAMSKAIQKYNRYPICLNC